MVEPEDKPDDPSADDDESTPSAPRAAEVAAKKKRRTDLFLGAFLAFQLIVPLTYYLRADPYDERFAWRMFSAIRLHSCQTSVNESVAVDGVEQARTVNLRLAVHQAWITTLGRNRRNVIQAFLERRCEEPSVVEVRLSNRCAATDGTALNPQDYVRRCDTGELMEPERLIVPEVTP